MQEEKYNLKGYSFFKKNELSKLDHGALASVTVEWRSEKNRKTHNYKFLNMKENTTTLLFLHGPGTSPVFPQAHLEMICHGQASL